GGVVLLDVTSRAIGLAVGGGPCHTVVARNATIPTREHRIVTTATDDQHELTFDVYEGESPRPEANRHLGRFVCSDLPAGKAGQVVVMVEFTVDVDGILRVSATELTSGQPPQLRLVAAAGLSRADVARLSRIVAA
ncbi:MAG: Hsp70 family protein, partial [Myxococcota bacterium]